MLTVEPANRLRLTLEAAGETGGHKTAVARRWSVRGEGSPHVQKSSYTPSWRCHGLEDEGYHEGAAPRAIAGWPRRLRGLSNWCFRRLYASPSPRTPVVWCASILASSSW